MGIFNKEATETTPAQQQYNDNVNTQVGHYIKTVMPLNAFYTQQNENNRAGMQDIAEGQQASAASVQAQQVSGALTERHEQEGAAPGSGAFAADIVHGGEMDAAARSSGITGADADAQRSYLGAVTKALGNDNASAQIGLQGLASAANQEQQEAQIATDIDNSRKAQVGQISTTLFGSGIQGMARGGGGGGGGMG
jgi:hypothetical protein